MKKFFFFSVLLLASGCQLQKPMHIGKGDTEPVVGWWKFDEGKGSIVANSGSAGNRYDGKLNNMDQSNWVLGRIGDFALSFDGKEEDVEIGPLNLNSNTVTITAWVKRNGDQSGYAGIVF